MKKSITVSIALAVLASGGVAWALDKNSLTVRASVMRTCRFSSASAPRYWCTNDVTAGTVPATNGGNRTPNAGPGSPRTQTIDGSLPGADDTGVTAGSYRDSVILTINP